MNAQNALLVRFFSLLTLATLTACAALPSIAPPAETPAQQPAAVQDVEPREAMATAANPYAVQAAAEILAEGGSAVDAAIAAEMVLGLVEPQSSGIGGGGFLLHYDAHSTHISAYDGRERAPAGATPTMFLDSRGQPMPFMDAAASGRSIGAPALTHMLKLAHDDHGRLPWARLFESAIALADGGFEVSPRLERLLAIYAERGRLRADFGARGYFFDRDGRPLQAGAILRNPQYAATLRAIAERGPSALTEGPIANAIVAAAQNTPRAGTLALEDLQAVRARRVEPVCGAYRVYRVCTMAPPSSANTVVEILGLYQRARPQPEGPDNADDWSAFMWASRLAYADRDHYMADDAFVQTPTQEMIAPAYLDRRAALIDPMQAPQDLEAGMPAGEELFNAWGRDAGDDGGTTHISIVDAEGHAVALTASIEGPFGSQRMAGGFLLNNQLTDFSFRPTLNDLPVANAAAPLKAPRSSMSPTIVTDRNGALRLVVGSPGGSAIISYVARTTIAVLDWNMPVQDAVALGNVTARTAPARIEAPRMPPGILPALEARGWQMRESALEASGIHVIAVTPRGLEGAADPRREGVVARISSAPPPPVAPPAP